MGTMTDPRGTGRRHFRNKPRPGQRVELRYQIVEGGVAGPPIAAYTANIGVGGAFIVTDPRPPGTLLRVELELPGGGGALAVEAEVRWISDGEEEPGRGMGVRFQGMSAEQTRQLNTWFASLAPTLDHDDIG